MTDNKKINSYLYEYLKNAREELIGNMRFNKNQMWQTIYLTVLAIVAIVALYLKLSETASLNYNGYLLFRFKCVSLVCVLNVLLTNIMVLRSIFIAIIVLLAISGIILIYTLEMHLIGYRCSLNRVNHELLYREILTSNIEENNRKESSNQDSNYNKNSIEERILTITSGEKEKCKHDIYKCAVKTKDILREEQNKRKVCIKECNSCRNKRSSP